MLKVIYFIIITISYQTVYSSKESNKLQLEILSKSEAAEPTTTFEVETCKKVESGQCKKFKASRSDSFKAGPTSPIEPIQSKKDEAETKKNKSGKEKSKKPKAAKSTKHEAKQASKHKANKCETGQSSRSNAGLVSQPEVGQSNKLEAAGQANKSEAERCGQIEAGQTNKPESEKSGKLETGLANKCETGQSSLSDARKSPKDKPKSFLEKFVSYLKDEKRKAKRSAEKNHLRRLGRIWGEEDWWKYAGYCDIYQRKFFFELSKCCENACPIKEFHERPRTLSDLEINNASNKIYYWTKLQTICDEMEEKFTRAAGISMQASPIGHFQIAVRYPVICGETTDEQEALSIGTCVAKWNNDLHLLHVLLGKQTSNLTAYFIATQDTIFSEPKYYKVMDYLVEEKGVLKFD